MWIKGIQTIQNFIKQKTEPVKPNPTPNNVFKGAPSWVKKVAENTEPKKVEEKPAPSWIKKVAENTEPKKVEETKKVEEKPKIEEKPKVVVVEKKETEAPKPVINFKEKELEKQIAEHLKKIQQLEEQHIKKDEAIARILEDTKQLTQDKSKLQEELRVEKEHSSHLAIERNRFEKESKVPLNEKLKSRVEALENENTFVQKKINDLEKELQQSRTNAKNLEESLAKRQAESASYSKEVETLKNEKNSQAAQLNQQLSEIQKLRNELKAREQELKDKSQYIESTLRDINKGTQENEQLKKQFEAAKEAQDKLVEEKRQSLEKSNKISELELEVKDSHLKLKQSEEKVKTLETQVLKLQEERAQEKAAFDDTLRKIKEAFEVLQEKVIIYGTPGVDLVEAKKEEEAQVITAKMTLRDAPNLYFIFELFQGIREKIRVCEEMIKQLEERLSSKIDPQEHENLKKALADAEDDRQSLNSQLFSIQREYVEKNQLLLERIQQYSIQFAMQVKNMFIYTKQRRSSISFSTQLDTFGKEFPQLKNVQELHEFLRDNVKKDLDETKATLETKTKENEELKAKIAELQAQLDLKKQEIMSTAEELKRTAGENEKLQYQLSNLGQNVKDLDLKLKESHGKTSNFEGELLKRAQEKEEITSKMKALEKRAFTAEAKAAHLETQTSILTQDKENLTQNLNILKEKLNQETKQCLDMSNIIAKNESRIKDLEASLEESQKRAATFENESFKRNKEKDELAELVKSLREKLTEENEELLKKSNRISDLEISIQKFETKAKEAEQKAMNVETQMLQLNLEISQEKAKLAELLKNIKNAFKALANAVPVPGTPNYNREDAREAEEKLTVTVKSSLEKSTDFYFIFEIYQILRDKIRKCEEYILKLEARLAEMDTLKKTLSEVEKDKEDLAAKLQLTQTEATEKQQLLLEKINQFSTQFNTMVKNMFLQTRERRSSVSFTSEIELLSKEFPQLKNIEELQDFLRTTVKKELDETKATLEEKTASIEKLQEKNSTVEAECNQLKAELEKLRNELNSKDTEIREKSQYISSVLQDMRKGSEENENLKKILETAKETQEKLTEEKKISVEKSNKIADLEMQLKETISKAVLHEEELVKFKKEVSEEKQAFTETLKSIRAAFEVLPDAIVIPETSNNTELNELRRKEEELSVAAELSLKNSTELYFINDLFHAMREKIKVCEERAKNFEHQSQTLTESLVLAEKEKSALNSSLATIEKEHADKSQAILQALVEFSKQFNLSVRNMFHEEEINKEDAADLLENIGKELHELNEFRDLYKFLRETIKSSLDKVKSDLAEKTEEVAKSQRRTSELLSQLEMSKQQIKALQEAEAESNKNQTYAARYEEFGNMLVQLSKNIFMGISTSEAHASLLQKLEVLAEGQSPLEFGKKLCNLIEKEMGVLKETITSTEEEIKELEILKNNTAAEAAKLKEKVRTLQVKVEEAEKIQREREYIDKKRETDAISTLKESEVNKMKRDIATFEEFSLNFLVLLKESFTKSTPESKRREEKLRALADGYPKLTGLMLFMSTIEELRQKDRDAALKEVITENEHIKKENKLLLEQSSGLRSENGALKEKMHFYAENYEKRLDKFKALKKLLARIGEYNILLYSVIREQSGEQVNTTEFFKLSDRKNRLKQLSEGIEELQVLNELYAFISNKKLNATQSSPQKPKGAGINLHLRNNSAGQLDFEAISPSHQRTGFSTMTGSAQKKLVVVKESPKIEKKANYGQELVFEEYGAGSPEKGNPAFRMGTPVAKNGSRSDLIGKSPKNHLLKSPSNSRDQLQFSSGTKQKSNIVSPSKK